MRLLTASILAVCAIVASACGYALAGRGNALPAHIVRIGIPTFLNESTTPDIDRVFSDAVRTEFQSRGRYVVVQDATGVDAVVSGSIKPVLLTVAAMTDTRQVSKYLITVQSSVEFKDLRDNKVLFTNQNLRVTDEYEVAGAVLINDASSLFSRDANALTRLAKTYARSLVASILEAF